MQETMQRTERQARWLLWQMDGVTVEGEAAPVPVRPVQQMVPVPEVRRARYEAVMRRMQEAGQRTTTYTPWN